MLIFLISSEASKCEFINIYLGNKRPMNALINFLNNPSSKSPPKQKPVDQGEILEIRYVLRGKN